MKNKLLLPALGLSLSMMFASVVDAENHKHSNDNGITTPVCFDRGGKQITFQRYSTWDLRKERAGLAMAFYEGNRPVVAYDVERLTATPKIFQQHVFQHECSHHELGHTRLRTGLSDKQKDKIEQETDCHALHKLEFGEKEIEIIASTFKKLYPKYPDAQINWSMPDKHKTLKRCL